MTKFTHWFLLCSLCLGDFSFAQATKQSSSSVNIFDLGYILKAEKSLSSISPVSSSSKSSVGKDPSTTVPDVVLPPASMQSLPGEVGRGSSSSHLSSSSSESSESFSSSSESSTSTNEESQSSQSSSSTPEFTERSLISPKLILGTKIPSNSSATLSWIPEEAVGGFSENTPVLVIHGKTPGMTLCLTGAIHGDELNGIEMIRRIMHSVQSEKLTGTLIGVPVANIMGFRRNSRYLPDRRDWNRYFPGNTYGSSASRLAHSFFSNIILHCDALVDIHTGSFHRTNLTQLRADLTDEKVAALAQNFGSIAVLNSHGNPNSLRAAAVRAGIPAVTLEAGEPMAMQSKIVAEGTDAIMTLISKLGMYGKQPRWRQSSPVYYRSSWVRANQSGILFSRVQLGNKVKRGDVLATVTDPITNAKTEIKSPYDGRVIGMALDQVVMPGFATHHIGIQTLEAMLLEESAPMDDGIEDEDAGDEGFEDGDDDMTEIVPAPSP
jgi:predicted deacylase